VKGGCIEGLDWSNVKHIWCKRAMVPIPEGVERSEEEPEEDFGIGAAKNSGGGVLNKGTGLGIGMGKGTKAASRDENLRG